MTAALIELAGVTKIFQFGEVETPVLRGVDLSIREGEFVAIMGASGSGKSTLLNLIGCLDRPTGGSYRLEGQEVAELSPDELAALRCRTFGFIFQRYHLISGLNALENVEVPAVYAGLNRAARQQKAGAILTRLGLAERLTYRPSQLSGGQQQRVSIARALMNGGRVILADEPTGALDSASGVEVMALLHQLHREGHTIIMVTHDPNLAEQADRIIRISDGMVVGDEKVRQTEVQEVPPEPAPVGESQFLGSSDFTEGLRMALRALGRNRNRTFLTMLGIIIGVASVVAMLAIGSGAKQEVLARIQAMGTNLLVVKPGAPGVKGAGTAVTTLMPEDAEAVARLPGVTAAVPEMLQPVTLRYLNKDLATSVTATTPDFSEARNWAATQGSFFSPEEVQRYSQVAVLGQTVEESVFGGVNPLGRYVLLGNSPFKVIGVMTPKGIDPGGNDLDNMVWVPLTTGAVRLMGQRYLKSISVQVTSEPDMDRVQQAIEQLLQERHKKEDFQVKSLAALMETATQTQDTLTYLLGAIAAISLIVGGIGVMNIMLVSVTERTREIGIRMAVGARAFDVLLQFITEGVVVCLIGGLIGVGVGIAGGLAVSRMMGWLALFTAGPILLAFACAFITGIIFSFLPARKAAHLDPVVALVTE